MSLLEVGSNQLFRAADNRFRQRGVRAGDLVDIVTVIDGVLDVAGRILVGQVMDTEDARRILGTDDLWETKDHLIPVPGTVEDADYNRPVQPAVTRCLRLLSGGEEDAGLRSTKPSRQSNFPARAAFDGGVREGLLNGAIGSPPSDRNMKLKTFFDPDSLEDARERIQASIAKRQGRSAFRDALLGAYEGRCAMSGCNVEEAMQAAQLIPRTGPSWNHCSNGLRLRADLRTLFDSSPPAIVPETPTLALAPPVRRTACCDLAGRKSQTPENHIQRFSKQALKRRRKLFEERIWRALRHRPTDAADPAGPATISDHRIGTTCRRTHPLTGIRSALSWP